jgi:centromeric protein E
MGFYDQGEARRKFASNNINFNSSRSHTIFRINLEVAHEDLTTSSSTISMVDLAGSESISKTNAVGLLKKESENINKSLLTLSKVIRELGDKNNYISYRDSKLTRILQECLTGNSKTVVICTVNQNEGCVAETINTLKFGRSVNAVLMTVHKNVAPSAAKNRPNPEIDTKYEELCEILENERAEKANLNDQLARLKG